MVGAIFKDPVIRHDVPGAEVREGVPIGNPEIVVEVNDRTINVYVRSFLPPKRLQQQGNVLSGQRYEPVLVWSRTYWRFGSAGGWAMGSAPRQESYASARNPRIATRSTLD